MNRRAQIVFWVLMAMIMPPCVAAHDFWIEPSSFEAGAPATVSLGVRVGEDFEGSPVRRRASSIASFVASGPSGVRDVKGLEGRDPAGFLRVDRPGLYAVGYQSRGQRIELEASSFEAYLEHEGLEGVIAERRERGESGAPGRERFVRCAKSLIVAAETGAAEPTVSEDGDFDRALGLELELHFDEDPRQAFAQSGDFALRASFRGEAVPDLLVVGLRRDGTAAPVSARTDAEGRVRLASSAGEWLIKAIHMVREEDDPGVDWTSYWASLTFAVNGGEAEVERAESGP